MEDMISRSQLYKPIPSLLMIMISSTSRKGIVT